MLKTYIYFFLEKRKLSANSSVKLVATSSLLTDHNRFAFQVSKSKIYLFQSPELALSTPEGSFCLFK